MKRLNDVFFKWNISFGFFQALYAWFTLTYGSPDTPPWLNSVTSTHLDFVYHGTVSGYKPISRLVENFVENDEISLQNARNIASMFWTMFGDYCTKQYNMLSLQYDPLNNYKIHETYNHETEMSFEHTETGTETTQKTGTESLQKSGTESKQTSGTEHLQKDGSIRTTTDTLNGIYGFDSITDVNSDKTHTESVQSMGVNGNTVAETRTPNLSEIRTPNLSETRTPNLSETRAPNLTNSETRSETSEGSGDKTGNIGIYTNQQLIESELKLWEWNFFYRFVFPAVDRILTLPVY